MADLTPETWAATLLRRLGIHQTPGAVQALVGWSKAEGGHWHNQARFNPLNTTQPMPGAGNTGSQGNIKVYRDWSQGIDATARTLRNGRYGGILSALQSGDPGAVANAIGRTPWGTSGGLVRSTIAGTPRRAGVSAAALGGPAARPSTSSGPRTRTITTETPGVDNRAARASLVASFLEDKNSDVLDFATQARALRDIPPTVTKKTTSLGGSGAAPGSRSAGGSVDQLVRRADAIDAQRLPYRWGGGHQGRTSIQQAVPLDCSGAVSKVLGIDPRVSGQFTTWGRPGDGGNRGVTIAANAGHVLMKINGHWFGTSGTNPGGGAGWIPQSAISPEYLKGFTLRHSAG